jgi:hypothetical protein
VCVLGCVGWIQRYLPHLQVLRINVFFHVGKAWVDEGPGKINHGVLLLPVANELLDIDELVVLDALIVKHPRVFLLSMVAKA